MTVGWIMPKITRGQSITSKYVMLANWKLKSQTHYAISLIVGLLLYFTTGVDAGAGGIETAGDVLQIVLPATAAGMTLIHKDGEGALQFGKSAALTLGVTYGLKYTVDDERPKGGGSAFPSGHTSISFCAAEFMRKRYGWEYGIPAYVAATFVGYSRVESREHYTDEVIVGAAIGIVSSYIFTSPFKGWQIQPETGSKYWGMRFSHKW